MNGFFDRRFALAKEFAAAVRLRAPDIDVTIQSPTSVELSSAQGVRVTCSLDSFMRDWKASEERGALLDRHVTIMLQMFDPPSKTVDLLTVLPFLKPAGWSLHAQRTMGGKVLAIDAGDELELTLVQLNGEKLSFLLDAEPDNFGLDIETLGIRAKENFERLAAEAVWTPVDDRPARFVSLEDRTNFSATLALSPAIWRRAEEALSANVLCAIPDRDTCIFFDRSDAAQLDELSRVVLPKWFEEAAYPISRRVYELRDNRLCAAPIAHRS